MARAPIPMPRMARPGGYSTPQDFWARPGVKDFASNALIDLGYGLTRGKNLNEGFQDATQRGVEMQPYREQQAAEQQQLAKAEEQKNQTLAFLQQKHPELAEMVNAGAPIGEVWNQLMTAPAAQKPTSSMQEYEFARSQGYSGTFQQYETDMKRAGATSIDFNQGQGIAAGYADRMAAANAILDDPKVTGAQTDIVEQSKSAIPGLGNFITSEDRKLAEQAQRDFVNAILRRESGAAIAPSEFENASKQYFPQPGDTPAVIEQKRQNRVLAIQGVQRSAGPNYSPPPSIGGAGTVLTYNPATGELE